MPDILDELAAALARGRNDYPRRAPLAGDVPPLIGDEPMRLPTLLGDRLSLEMQGGYGWNPRERYQMPFGRQMLQSMLGGGFPAPTPGPAYGPPVGTRNPFDLTTTPSSEGWQPGISLRARFPF